MIFLVKLTKTNIEENIKKIFNSKDNFEYEYISNTEDDTKFLGREFAKYINIGDIITLNGELGSGKTVFLNGLASYYGIENEVSSPTFTIVNEYNPKNLDFPIYHLDVYRIKNSDEFVQDIGTEYFYDGAVLIEWGDYILKDILPKNTIHIDISKDDNDVSKRIIKIWRKI